MIMYQKLIHKMHSSCAGLRLCSRITMHPSFNVKCWGGKPVESCYVDALNPNLLPHQGQLDIHLHQHYCRHESVHGACQEPSH